MLKRPFARILSLYLIIAILELTGHHVMIRP
jgi:hypothetical protein